MTNKHSLMGDIVKGVVVGGAILAAVLPHIEQTLQDLPQIDKMLGDMGRQKQNPALPMHGEQQPPYDDETQKALAFYREHGGQSQSGQSQHPQQPRG